MTDKSRFRVKKLGAPEYAPDGAGVFCGGFGDGVNRKLHYGKSYRMSEVGKVIMTAEGEVIDCIAIEQAKQLEKMKFGRRE